MLQINKYVVLIIIYVVVLIIILIWARMNNIDFWLVTLALTLNFLIFMVILLSMEIFDIFNNLIIMENNIIKLTKCIDNVI